MEAAENDDPLDDWFFESLKSYKDLHVFQLERPTQVIEWTSAKTVCVAGFHSSKNEILELRLPDVGCCLNLCCVLPDVIRRTGSIRGTSASQTGTRIAAPPSAPGRVLHGARSSDVRLTHLSTGQTLYKLAVDSAEPLTSLKFVGDAAFLACCSDGTVYAADTRTPAAPRVSPPPASAGESLLWWADASAAPQQSCWKVVRVSSSAQAVVSDLRNLGGALGGAQLDLQTAPCRPGDVTVSWAPALDGCFSVSGFGGLVQIYDTAGWRTAPQDARPLFQHRGHVVPSRRHDDSDPASVTVHAWHPERPRTLLSAASDGSVHVWDWVEPEAG
uniref:WD repeat domain 73 n=1 Tax=Fundulus heteroclitus TaxID=8078 RepID=A0A3Q2QQK9_FUNHE